VDVVCCVGRGGGEAFGVGGGVVVGSRSRVGKGGRGRGGNEPGLGGGGGTLVKVGLVMIEVVWGGFGGVGA